MTTEITFRREVPPATPRHARLLSPQERKAHRETIAFSVKTVLSAYFQPHEAEEIRAAQLAWWCDELQDWSHEQVVWGLRKWNRASPRLRPTPGDIVAILKAARGRKIAAEMPREETGPDRKPVTREEAEAIIAQAGFKLRRVPSD